MNKLLSFNPEPFDAEAELETMPQGYQADGRLTENEDEYELRRPRGSSSYSRSKSAPSPRAYGNTSRKKPLTKPSRGKSKQSKPSTADPDLPFIPREPPSSVPPNFRFPTLPIVFPTSLPYPVPEKPEPPETNSGWRIGGDDQDTGRAPPEQEPDDFSSAHVQWVQNCLNQFLGTRLPPDGRINAATRASIRLFQERRGLPVTGMIGPETEEALAKVCKTAGVPPPATDSFLDPQYELEFKTELPKRFNLNPLIFKGKPTLKGRQSNSNHLSDGSCQDQVTETIANWGQYSSQIPQNQKPIIDKLANLVVSSFAQSTCPPFRTVQFVGHSDKDWQGPKKEWEVSRDRANAVRIAFTDAVKNLWSARKMPAPYGGDVRWEGFARGSKAMIAEPYNPVNRRVEITLIRSGPIIPPTPRPTQDDTLEKRIARLLKLLTTRRLNGDTTGKRTNRAKCLLPKLLIPSVVDVFVDGGVANQTINGMTPKHYECLIPGRNVGWLGNYDGTKKPMTNNEFMKFLGTIRPILRGSGFAPTQSDDHVLLILGEVILRIDQGITMVDNYINRMGMMSDPIVKKLLHIDGFAGDVARKKLQRLYRDHLDDENNIYSCYR